MASELVAGVDGTSEGWVVCVAAVDEPTVEFRAGSVLAEVLAGGFAVVAIDMPIGLPSGSARAADEQARDILQHRSPTLFRTPDHATLAAADYDDARRLSVDACGKSLMKQAYNLFPKIIEVRGLLGAPQPHVHEVHPETSFTVMNEGVPLAPKSTSLGHGQRVDLVSRWRPALGPVAAALSIDAIDAAAAAWTAVRVHRGEHRTLGDGTDPDGYPLTMAV